MKPPKLLIRNEWGLFEDFEYLFNENNSVNYRGIVPVKYLYVNPTLSKRKNIESRYSKPYKDIDIEKDQVQDSDIVLLLSGVKFLLNFRGYNRIESIIKQSNHEYASVTVLIEFLGN
ncbi:MAG: hypothetical protein AABY22_06520, partial [Nanoarchaeota archaeon]